MNWSSNTKQIEQCLQHLSVYNISTNNIPTDKAFDMLLDTTIGIKKQKNTIFLIGNGASASMASHVATDLAKNAHVHTEVFFDLSLITAIANDTSYEEIFAEPLRRRMKKADMLVAISSSGQSPNILRATQEAKNLEGFIVTLSAMRSENELRNLGHLNFYVPASTYGMAETCHAAILHYWIDKMVATTN